ncbi:hypothetical protein [Vibrio sp. 1CM23M]|uniref:hypothetical protein n=1 Tax=Vibrio sp. 1CM23M TaxID=2929164 RepID=UPI0020BD66D0|nr:hypothetical protein [Vibrio sp. 1CM23M]MCK8072428.1 hypothetical protein [Vibrio sp. 1CM23M]
MKLLQTLSLLSSILISIQIHASDIKLKDGIYYQTFTDNNGNVYYQCFTGGPISNPYINKTQNWLNTDKQLTGCAKAIQANK